ncbi:MAG: hypothetical protein FWF33_00595 [Clostridiales bacterium]|nr:hypothetical protein [Clostridiales bacterium]
MITRAEFIRELPIRLAGTEYEGESHAYIISTGCVALLLGTNGDQVNKIMKGYPKIPIGNHRKYHVEDVFEMLKERGMFA